MQCVRSHIGSSRHVTKVCIQEADLAAFLFKCILVCYLLFEAEGKCTSTTAVLTRLDAHSSSSRLKRICA